MGEIKEELTEVRSEAEDKAKQSIETERAIAVLYRDIYTDFDARINTANEIIDILVNEMGGSHLFRPPGGHFRPPSAGRGILVLWMWVGWVG